MPEYPYKCEACGKSFSKTMGIKEHDTAKIVCPKCASTEVKQQVTKFGAITSKKS